MTVEGLYNKLNTGQQLTIREKSGRIVDIEQKEGRQRAEYLHNNFSDEDV